MILYVALALLFAWALGMLGAIPLGALTHVLLLIGLLLLLVAFLKARDAAGGSHPANSGRP